MGTRHLIAAVIDGDFKIAQYGQWDGYPSGQGVSVLNFIANVDHNAFRAALRACHWITAEEISAIDDATWKRTHPQLSRDAGSDVLDLVLSAGGLALKDSRGFAGDSLFCEYAYVLDFDRNVFEIFQGFNKTPTAEGSRFPSGASWLEDGGDYAPVRLIQSYDFDCLPSKEGFLSDLHPSDDQEDNE